VIFSIFSDPAETVFWATTLLVPTACLGRFDLSRTCGGLAGGQVWSLGTCPIAPKKIGERNVRKWQFLETPSSGRLYTPIIGSGRRTHCSGSTLAAVCVRNAKSLPYLQAERCACFGPVLRRAERMSGAGRASCQPKTRPLLHLSTCTRYVLVTGARIAARIECRGLSGTGTTGFDERAGAEIKQGCGFRPEGSPRYGAVSGADSVPSAIRSVLPILPTANEASPRANAR